MLEARSSDSLIRPCFWPFADRDDVASLDQHRSDVGGVAVQFDGAVAHQLASFGAGRAEAHAVDDVVQARFQQLDQRFAGVATATLGFSEVLAELLFQHAVHALELLLFAQLQAVVGSAGARSAAVLARLGIQLALGIQRATGALQEQVSTLAARACIWVQYNVPCGFPLDTTTLRRTAAVVRNGRDVGDARDLDAQRVQGADRRFTAGAGALDAHFQRLDAVFQRNAASRFSGDLRGERGRLTRALKPAPPDVAHDSALP